MSRPWPKPRFREHVRTGNRLLVASDGIEYSPTLGVKNGDEAGLGEWQFGRNLEGA